MSDPFEFERAAVWDAYLAQHPTQKRLNDEVDVEHFNLHVTPDLEAAINGYASLLRTDTCDWTEAFDHVMAYAWRRGAWGFSDQHLGELLDWVGSTLTAAIDRR